MSAHTKTPWATDAARIYAEDIFIATVWPLQISERKEPKESWLAMRERTGPARREALAETLGNARFIALACNAHDDLFASLAVMTALVRMHYGNLDAEIFAEIEKAESALAKAGEK